MKVFSKKLSLCAVLIAFVGTEVFADLKSDVEVLKNDLVSVAKVQPDQLEANASSSWWHAYGAELQKLSNMETVLQEAKNALESGQYTARTDWWQREQAAAQSDAAKTGDVKTQFDALKAKVKLCCSSATQVFQQFRQLNQDLVNVLTNIENDETASLAATTQPSAATVAPTNANVAQLQTADRRNAVNSSVMSRGGSAVGVFTPGATARQRR